MKVKITKYASNICWWMGNIDQECEVLEIYEPTNYMRIKVKKYDPNVIGNGEYELEGYIPSDCVEIVK